VFTDDPRPRFHLEIHGLEEFQAFCAILRGERVDPAQLHEMTARLSQSTDTLKAAVAETGLADHLTS
jgi:hypothetical protein